MLDRLAIIITGNQNAGKTTTLKHFCNTYRGEAKDVFRQGWRFDITPFKDKYYGVKVWAYFLPSSRTEKKVPLKDTFETLEWWPDFLFMAEQLNGSEYDNTIRYLRGENYHIKEFILDNSNPDTIWHYYDEADKDLILLHRTEQIADYVRNFILSRI